MPRGRRKWGRLKLYWLQNIAQTVRERRLEGGVWEDGDGWRIAVNAKNGHRKIKCPNSMDYEPRDSMPHSQGFSYNPRPEPNQPSSLYWHIPYLREYKVHLFQPNIAVKIGVRIRFEGALDSSTNLNNIQLYRL